MSETKFITGINCLTIPCDVGKHDSLKARPIYLGPGYICPFCGTYFHGYIPCSHHMGMVMNIPGNCKKSDWWHRVTFNQQLPCAFCPRKFSDFLTLGEHVRTTHPEIGRVVRESLAAQRNNNEEDEVGKSIATMKQERGIGGPPMLRGQDLPKGTTKVKIKVRELREAPQNFKSPAIIDLDSPVHEREAFAVNITNLRALAELVGLDPEMADFDVLASKVKGKSFDLHVSMTNNPQSKKMVRSLFFAADGR